MQTSIYYKSKLFSPSCQTFVHKSIEFCLHMHAPDEQNNKQYNLNLTTLTQITKKNNLYLQIGTLYFRRHIPIASNKIQIQERVLFALNLGKISNNLLPTMFLAGCRITEKICKKQQNIHQKSAKFSEITSENLQMLTN